MVLSAGGSIARLLGTLVSMNLLKRRSAERAVMFQAPFVMDTGVIGVSHHYWWVGQPDVWIPFGSVFSTLEPIAVHPGQWESPAPEVVVLAPERRPRGDGLRLRPAVGFL